MRHYRGRFWMLGVLGLWFCALNAGAVDVLESTPVGSWQQREESTIDHKGREAVALVRSSMIAKEERNGQPHYWIEVESQNYKVKNGKRKKDGDITIVKVLVSQAALTGDPGDIMSNLRGIGDEIILQSGDQQPMRITGGGAMADAMLQAMGTQMDYDYRTAGEKDVSVPAGTFTCTVHEGSGYTEMKVMFKTIRVESETQMCLSGSVPFALVSSESESVTNGDKSKTTVKLLEFGASGAVSKITRAPADAPSLPSFLN